MELHWNYIQFIGVHKCSCFIIIMGNLSTRFTNFFSTDHILDQETIATYVELTYLNKDEIQQ